MKDELLLPEKDYLLNSKFENNINNKLKQKEGPLKLLKQQSSSKMGPILFINVCFIRFKLK